MIISINLPIEWGDKNKNKALVGEASLYHFSQERVVFGNFEGGHSVLRQKYELCHMALFCLFCHGLGTPCLSLVFCETGHVR